MAAMLRGRARNHPGPEKCPGAAAKRRRDIGLKLPLHGHGLCGGGNLSVVGNTSAAGLDT